MPGGRRGRPARTEPAEPTGYRVTTARRRLLQLAMAFTGERTMQAVLDQAVDHWLDHLRRERRGFAAAADEVLLDEAPDGGG